MTDAEKKSASIRLAQGDARVSEKERDRGRERETTLREEKRERKRDDEGEKKPIRSRGPPRCSYPIYLVRDLHSLRALVY